jgi:hypothetical protein
MSGCSSAKFNVKQLQGSWWASTQQPSADFGISGDQVWLDYDSQYHPCKIEGDILIFEIGNDRGFVKNKIIGITKHSLVLENVSTKKRTTYTLNDENSENK